MTHRNTHFVRLGTDEFSEFWGMNDSQTKSHHTVLLIMVE